MKFLVLQIEDRNTDKLQTFMQHNRQVCTKNNMEYIFMEKSTANVPPYWAKIVELQNLMRTKPDVEYVMWLDSDAFFINFDSEKFQNFLKKYDKYSMIITKDMPPWNGDFNAGSFIIKNNEIGRNIVKEWLTHYNPNNWSIKEDGKWSTPSTWAGDDYEQGSFVKYILYNPSFKQDIIQLNYNILNNNNCDTIDETIVSHLADSKYKDDTIYKTCISTFDNYSSEGFTSQNNIDNIDNTNSKTNNDMWYLLYLLFFIIIVAYWYFIYLRKYNTKFCITKMRFRGSR